MSAYYNENDPFPAEWLRNLSAAGHIAAGTIDERSIRDVDARDLEGFDQAHFFAGIGAWSHALRLAGWADDAPVWTGSCPCQPFSVAGRGAEHADERHLWPAWFHLIRERHPRVVLGEQVAGSAGERWLDAVQADLEAEGYTFGSVELCAAGAGAPHIRQRLYWCAIERGSDPARGGARAAQQRGCLHGTVANSEACGNADAERAGRRELAPSRIHGDGIPGDDTHGRRAAVGSADADERAGGQGGAVGAGSDHRGDARSRAGPCGSGRAVVDLDAERARLEGLAGDERVGDEPRWLRADAARSASTAGATRGFWRDAAWWWGRDGVYRPTQPGVLPLAHGSPGRVGRLRAYGNAIVAPLATAFVGAVMDWLER